MEGGVTITLFNLDIVAASFPIRAHLFCTYSLSFSAVAPPSEGRLSIKGNNAEIIGVLLPNFYTKVYMGYIGTSLVFKLV